MVVVTGGAVVGVVGWVVVVSPVEAGTTTLVPGEAGEHATAATRKTTARRRIPGEVMSTLL